MMTDIYLFFSRFADLGGKVSLITQSKIKQLIKKFHEELHGFRQKRDADDVYHINVQMFPLTEALPK
jgi:hypothetical protein